MDKWVTVNYVIIAQFKEGYNGQSKVVKNKAGSEIKQRINYLFDASFTLETIQADLQALEPKDRLKFMADLMPYVVPKLQSTTYKNEVDLDSLSEEQLDRMIERFITAD